MGSPENKENLAKLSLEALEELYEREKNILKNKKLIEKLPDKGEQLKEKLRKVEKEIQHRKDIKELENTMNNLLIGNESVDVLNEKHVQHICQIEKSPNKERYKPFSTLANTKESKDMTAKQTQLIPLKESITLQVEQATKLPVGNIKLKIEGEELEETEEDVKVEQTVISFEEE